MAAKGMTNGDLRRKTALSPRTIIRATGETIAGCRLTTLEAIAGALDVRIVDLFVVGRKQR